MSTLRLLWVSFRIGVMGEAQYRVNFAIQVFQSLLGLVTALAGLAVVFSYTDSLGGWSPDEVVALVGVYILVGGIIGVVIQPSMEVHRVDARTLDFTLTKPEEAQLLVSIQDVDIWEVLNILLGLGVLGVALDRLGESVGLAQAAAFGVMLLAGSAIVYAFWLILATLSFWFLRIENIPGHLPERLRGRPLARDDLPRVASLRLDPDRSGRLRRDRTGGSSDRPPRLADGAGRARPGGAAPDRLTRRVADRPTTILRRLGLGRPGNTRAAREGSARWS
jgi:ABC-type uncharacterized transport system permease subunit